MHALDRVGLESSEKGQKGGFEGFSVKKGCLCKKGVSKIKRVNSDMLHTKECVTLEKILVRDIMMKNYSSDACKDFAVLPKAVKDTLNLRANQGGLQDQNQCNN